MVDTLQIAIRENNTSDQTFLEKLKGLDLSPIVFKLCHLEDSTPWNREKAEKIKLQYKLFLYLIYAYPVQSIVPTKDIDTFWHQHILDTQLYHAHCSILFGKFLHHFPYFGVRDEEDKKALDKAFEQTKILMSLHSQIAGAEAACGVGCGASLCDNNACDSNSCGSENITFDIETLMSVRPTM